MPPPMKVSKEMLEAMGGIESETFSEFRVVCYSAFLTLRRHSKLILNLFTLMVDASIPDIAFEQDKAVKKVESNLKMNLGDEPACEYLTHVLETSISSLMPVMIDHLHKLGQYWRR